MYWQRKIFLLLVSFNVSTVLCAPVTGKAGLEHAAPAQNSVGTLEIGRLRKFQLSTGRFTPKNPKEEEWKKLRDIKNGLDPYYKEVIDHFTPELKQFYHDAQLQMSKKEDIEPLKKKAKNFIEDKLQETPKKWQDQWMKFLETPATNVVKEHAKQSSKKIRITGPTSSR